jgi:hypothetical protein
MVRKGSSVRVRQRALGSFPLLRGIADLPDAADATRVLVKVPRRYRAGRHRTACFADHVDRGAPWEALELLEDARVVPQARGRRVAELRCELDDIHAFLDQQAREAAPQVARAGVAWQADRDRGRLEDPLAPVVPGAAGPPLAARGPKHEIFIGRRAPQPPVAQVPASSSRRRVSRSTTTPLLVARNVIVRGRSGRRRRVALPTPAAARRT